MHKNIKNPQKKTKAKPDQLPEPTVKLDSLLVEANDRNRLQTWVY